MKIVPNLRSRFGMFALFLLTTAIAIPKSAHSQQIPNRNPANLYPAEVTSVFVNSCVSSAIQTSIPEATMRAVCQCVMWQLQDRYSFEEFKTFRQRVSQNRNRQDSQEFAQIVRSCSPPSNS